MLRRKATIIFALVGIGTVLGFIIGVVPGYFIKSLFDDLFFLIKNSNFISIGYGLYVIGGAFLLFILLFLCLAAVVYEYLVGLLMK